MAKKIIIDGVDVSECDCLDGEYCITDKEATFASLCEDKDCIYKQLKRKEQEYIELDKKAHEYLQENAEYALENSKLQAENEKLKEELKTVQNENLKECVKLIRKNGLEDHIVFQLLDIEGKNKNKYKQVLDEIVEIARERMAGYVPSVVANNTYEINMDKILSIIEQAKGEECQ